MFPVLHVDDDVELTSMPAQYRKRQGFAAHGVRDGESGAVGAASGRYERVDR